MNEMQRIHTMPQVSNKRDLDFVNINLYREGMEQIFIGRVLTETERPLFKRYFESSAVGPSLQEYGGRHLWRLIDCYSAETARSLKDIQPLNMEVTYRVNGEVQEPNPYYRACAYPKTKKEELAAQKYNKSV